jgi:hypothetical protein
VLDERPHPHQQLADGQAEKSVNEGDVLGCYVGMLQLDVAAAPNEG